MNYLDRLRAHFPEPTGPLSTSTPRDKAEALGPALGLWTARLQLPPEEVGTGDRAPECLAQVAASCVAILRRRPALGARVGISADELQALCRRSIDSEMLTQLAAALLQAVRDAQLLQTGRLAAENADLAAAFAAHAADPAVPAPARHRLVACTQSLRAAEARRLKRRDRAAQSRLRRAESARAESAEAAERIEAHHLAGALSPNSRP